MEVTQERLKAMLRWVGQRSNRIEQFISEFGEYNLAQIDSRYRRFFFIRYYGPERKTGIINLTSAGQMELQKILRFKK